MRINNLSRAVLSSPNQRENNEVPTSSRTLLLLKFDALVHVNHTEDQREAHQKRLKNLRKELLDNFNNLSWKYQPIEKYIGQS